MLIGIAGKARSGKDTAGRHLLDAYGFELMSFAAPIKRVVADLFGLDGRHLNGELKEVDLPGLNRSPRYLFQTLGTDWGRYCVHPDVWLFAADAWLKRISDEYYRQGERLYGAVFTDIRFENEAEWIRNKGGLVLHVERADAPGVESHVSEQGINLDTRDIKISNNGSIDELHKKLDDIVLALVGGS